jgi:hypothetical protein
MYVNKIHHIKRGSLVLYVPCKISFTIHIVTKYYYDDEIYKHEMGEAFSNHGKEKRICNPSSKNAAHRCRMPKCLNKGHADIVAYKGVFIYFVRVTITYRDGAFPRRKQKYQFLDWSAGNMHCKPNSPTRFRRKWHRNLLASLSG